jgi:hypothetical protein
MKNLLIGAAAAAALATFTVSAQAGCADPRVSPGIHKMPPMLLQRPLSARPPASAEKNIVGTWHATYTVMGNPFGEAYIQWHDDGTEWENIDFPAASGNICMGEWVPVDKKHVARTHVGWIYNEGTLAGYFTETETNEVAKDGNSYSGTNEQKVYDLEGNLLADVTGTSSATRFGP